MGKSIISDKQNTNCMNLIRIIGALQVMYGHVIFHLKVDMPSWFSEGFGVLQGVPIFYILSGFLIWFSVERSLNFKKYIKKRFWRIYPEMWIAIVVEISVMLILYHSTNTKDVLLFTVAQATFLQFWTPASLRGYGCGTPNGVLTSICVLIQFYFIAWFMYKLLHKKKLWIWGTVWVLSLGMSLTFDKLFEFLGVEIIYKLYRTTLIRYLWIFVTGMLIAEFFSELIFYLKKYWYIAFVFSIFFKFTFDILIEYRVFHTVFLALSIIGFAYRYPKLELKKDISYGIYVYHMTVVNAMIVLEMTGNIIDMVIAMVISCFLAYFSTITIGKYSLAKK